MHACTHTSLYFYLLLPINLMKMDLSNLFPDIKTITSQPVPCVVSSSSFALLFLRPVFPSLHWIRPPSDQKAKRARNLSPSPTRPSPDKRTTALIIWHFNIVLPFLLKIKGVIKLVKGDRVQINRTSLEQNLELYFRLQIPSCCQ